MRWSKHLKIVNGKTSDSMFCLLQLIIDYYHPWLTIVSSQETRSENRTGQESCGRFSWTKAEREMQFNRYGQAGLSYISHLPDFERLERRTVSVFYIFMQWCEIESEMIGLAGCNNYTYHIRLGTYLMPCNFLRNSEVCSHFSVGF